MNGLWNMSPSHKLYKYYKVYSLAKKNLFYYFWISIVAKIILGTNSTEEFIQIMSFFITFCLIFVANRYTYNVEIVQLLEEMFRKEDLILFHSNKSVKEIYRRHAIYSNRCTGCIFLTTSAVMIVMYSSWFWIEIRNGNVMFIPGYIPFNLSKVVWFYTLHNLINLYVVGFLYIYTKILFLSLIINAVISLKILQHFLENLVGYSDNYREQSGILREKAFCIILRTCILEHKYNIR